jgi:branched-chain amino acid aminotransferase
VDSYVSVAGRRVDPGAAAIAPTDRAVLAGEGAYEALRTYGRRPFALRQHLDRLAGSLTVVGIPLPDPAAVAAEVRRAVDAIAGAEVRVRITVTAGPGSAAAAGLSASTAPVYIVDARPLESWPAGEAPPVRCVTFPWPLVPGPLAGVKSTSLAAVAVARRWAVDRDADDGLFCDPAGRYLEACAATLFVAVGGALLTAPLSSGVLPGVTRAALMQIAAEAGVETREDTVDRAGLTGAGETFLGSSSVPWRPVGSLDGVALGPPHGPGRALAVELERRALAGWDPG